MAFASRQARGRRWGNRWRWRESSSAVNSSSSRGLTIRCRTMTAGSDVLLVQTAIDRAEAGVTNAKLNRVRLDLFRTIRIF